MPLLAIDVGAGTQDILLYQEGVPAEGLSKMIMPSRTVMLAKRIDRARRRGKDIFLQGPTMGGGAISAAVFRHLKARLKVYATQSAALTLNDDIEKVSAMGVKIDQQPLEAERIDTGDVDIPTLKNIFGQFELPFPAEIAVAVQDHGFSPGRSNRLARFEHLEKIIKKGGRLESFAFPRPPEHFNRMTAVKGYLEQMGLHALIMDTGPAALLGVTQDPAYVEPALVVNFGNGHTLGAVISERRILSLFEHHTSSLTPTKVKIITSKLCRGTLSNEEIFEDEGHGAFVGEIAEEIRSVLVTGPRRADYSGSLQELGKVVSAAPWGDMMIAGCVGLVEAWRIQED